MTAAELYRLGSVLVLAALLFIPVSKLIWVLSVRRLERRSGQPLTADARQGQRRRARFLALFAAPIFSWLFHLNVVWPLYG